MFTRFAPWPLLAAAAVALFGCAILSFAQTGDVLLFLVFTGMAALVGFVANVKRNWIDLGVVPSLLSYESSQRTFGPTNATPKD